MFKNYIFIKFLGEGANGSVVEVKKNNTHYAIKIQNLRGMFGNGHISIYELIINEINILQNLPKKYFLKFIEYYIDNKTHKVYIVTELINDSISLDMYINKYNYDEDTLFKISSQLCESIDLLHKKNIYHEDFFPRNIMICPKTLDIKIIDFGSSYLLKDSSIYFNKRENSKKSIVNAIESAKTVDLISLGMTLYTLFTHGHDLNQDYIKIQNTCGLNCIFENKDVMCVLLNAVHMSDVLFKKYGKKYKYYKSLQSLLYLYYNTVTGKTK